MLLAHMQKKQARSSGVANGSMSLRKFCAHSVFVPYGSCMIVQGLKNVCFTVAHGPFLLRVALEIVWHDPINLPGATCCQIMETCNNYKMRLHKLGRVVLVIAIEMLKRNSCPLKSELKQPQNS